MKRYRHGFLSLALLSVMGARALESIDFNKDWAFAFNSNTDEFVPLGLDASQWKAVGDLSFDPKWGAPSRLFNQCPTEGWLSDPDFNYPANIDVDMGRAESFSGMRLHFFGNAPLDYELYVGDDALPDLNITATASSEEKGLDHPAGRVLDGNPETRWCARGGKPDEWLMLDLGAVMHVSGLNITWEKDAAYQYRIETSVDRSEWIQVIDQQNASEAQLKTSDVFEAKARYVKVTITGLPPKIWASIREIAIPQQSNFSAPVSKGTFLADQKQIITFPPQTAHKFRLRILNGENPKSCWIGELELLNAADVARAKQLLDAPKSLVDFSKATDPGYDDSAWRKLDVPHDWSIEGEFNAGCPAGRNSGYLPGGLGFYRKAFFVPAEWAGKKVSVKFGGIYMNSSVYCNGTYLDGRNYGYCTYVVDLTPQLEFGQTNMIAVRVDNRSQPNSRWYTGSGIYRDVTLQVSDKIHVAQWGIFISTPEVSPTSAQVKIQTRIQNETNRDQGYVLATEIYSPTGEKITETTDDRSIKNSSEQTVEQVVTVRNPALWSPASPALYKAVSLIKSGQGKIDRIETSFGIRKVEFDPAFGLKLNGEKVVMKGVCLHHDLGAVGAADFPRAVERRLRELKKMGVNAIRTSHNPYSERFMQMCDEMGFMVIGEMYDKWNFGNVFVDPNGNKVEWKDTWPRDLAEFVMRDRNHPSVVVWSVGNEVAEQNRSKNVEGTGPGDGGVGIFNALKDCVVAVDDTRPVSVGLFPKMEEGDEPPKMAKAADVVGTNYLERHWKNWHGKHPGMVFYGSEVSTFNWGEVWFNWDKAYGAGQFYWGGTDYLGEGREWPNIGWYRGLIDLTGFIKDGAYYVKSFYNDEPMVRIAVQDAAAGSESIVWNAVKLTKDERRSHWNWQGMTNVTVYTYSNCEEVELVLNGRSLGIQKLAEVEKYLPTWAVPFEPGTLKAVARNGGKIVAEHEVKTAGKAERIVLQAERDSIGADGDLGYINALVVDAQGTVVPNAQQTIRFEVDGDGENFAVSSADMWCAESFKGNSRNAYQGKAQLIVRSLRPGVISIKATADGLEAGSAKLMAK